LNRQPAANVVWFAAIAAAGAGVDLVTKWLAFTRVGQPPARHELWPGVLSFTTSFNEGALWGIGRNIDGSNKVFAVFSVCAAIAILYWLLWRGAAREWALSMALGLIMAGVIGNCYDRMVWGRVRDWIYFELINWPIFNVADSCLVCGASLLVAYSLYVERQTSRSAATAAAPATASAIEVNEQPPGTTA
jgi:signal peptidase II